MIVALTLLLGAVVAFASVFLGLGGGAVLVPLLPDVFNLGVREAVATSVFTIFLATSMNTFLFQRQGLVAWPVVLIMGPVSAVTAFLAARVSAFVETRLILMFLIGILSLVVIRGFMASFLKFDYQVAEPLTPRQKGLCFLGGGLAGVTSGLAGVGSGVIISPLMIILKVIEPVKLSPTANANMVFATGAASVAFLANGEFQGGFRWGLIHLDIAVGVFVSAMVLAHFLRPYQNRLPFRAKSLILNAMLVLLIVKSVRML